MPLIVVNALRTNDLENIITFGNNNSAIQYDINSFTVTVDTSQINLHYQDKDGTMQTLPIASNDLFSALAAKIESVSIPPTPLSNRLSPWYILLMLAVILLLIAMIVLAVCAYKRHHLLDEDSTVIN